MDSLQTVIVLMWSSILLVGAAQKLKIAYPIALVLGGAIIGFLPGLNVIHFDPNLILIIVLPPILYQAAFSISFREFKKDWREIFSLALGLVFATTFVVGFVFKWLIPDCPWPLAFGFGAIVSPPDAVAATAILKRFNIGTRLRTILEGESLVNDASALLLYKLSMIALLSGSFSFTNAGFEFVQIAVGGILVGIVTGFALQAFSKYVLDAIVGVVFSFTIPYVTYIVADYFGFSGVLAVVVNGLIGSHFIITHQSSKRRIFGFTSWDVAIILLNCFVFILIGTQLKEITKEMSLSHLLLYTGYAAVIMITMILVRMFWVFLKHAIFYLKTCHEKKNAGQYKQIFSEDAVLGWSGMRGIVSLTAALALPLTAQGNTPIPSHSIIIFIVFMVILLTLIIPGLTLPLLLRWLRFNDHPEVDASLKMRKFLVQTALNEIELLSNEGKLTIDESEFLNNYFINRFKIFEISSSLDKNLNRLEQLRHQIVIKQRESLLFLWKNEKIDDLVMTTLERELDLEDVLVARAELV